MPKLRWLAWPLLAASAWLFLRPRGAPAPTSAPSPEPPPTQTPYDNVVASFYGPGYHGRTTASGEVFDQEALTAAHRTLPFGTRVRVTALDNGRIVTVRINDRGPFVRRADGSFSREIDLSVGAARVIGLDIQRGLARVRLDRV